MDSLVLFGHGARDPAWSRPLEELRDRIASRRPDLAVRLAFLEFMKPGLPEVVADDVARGVTRVLIVPVFIAQGGHVRREVSAEVDAIARAHPGIRVELAGAVGEVSAVQEAIADYVLAQLGPTAPLET